MIIENNFSTSPKPAICDRQQSNAELECKRLLTLHEESSKPDDMTVITCLHGLAQALEGQEKYAEGLYTRIRARDILISLMAAS